MFFRADTLIQSPEAYRFRLYLQSKDRNCCGWVRLKQSTVLKDLGISIPTLKRYINKSRASGYIKEYERNDSWLYVKYTSLKLIGDNSKINYWGICTKEEILNKNLLKNKAYEIIALANQKNSLTKYEYLRRAKSLDKQTYSYSEAKTTFKRKIEYNKNNSQGQSNLVVGCEEKPLIKVSLSQQEKIVVIGTSQRKVAEVVNKSLGTTNRHLSKAKKLGVLTEINEAKALDLLGQGKEANVLIFKDGTMWKRSVSIYVGEGLLDHLRQDRKRQRKYAKNLKRIEKVKHLLPPDYLYKLEKSIQFCKNNDLTHALDVSLEYYERKIITSRLEEARASNKVVHRIEDITLSEGQAVGFKNWKGNESFGSVLGHKGTRTEVALDSKSIWITDAQLLQSSYSNKVDFIETTEQKEYNSYTYLQEEDYLEYLDD